MTVTAPPALIFLIGAIIVPLLKGRTKTRKTYLICLTILGLANVICMQQGRHWVVPFLNYEIVFGNVDKLSLVFGYIFHIVPFLAVIFGFNIKTTVESTAGMVYTGSVVGVTFAGDFISLFCFWELMTLSAVALLWARSTKESLAAGFRYVIFHFFGSVILLVGIVLHICEKGSAEFGYVGLNGLSSYLIFIGLGVNCAWPLFHTWLTDSYGKSSVMGAVFMSAFTTKTAVYVMARTFPGAEPLIWIGAVMTIFPLLYALIENDLRTSLSYVIVNQLGFMMVGIGIGSELAINGVVSHAFTHILYDSVLFMSLGAVLYRTGTIKASDLGGLFRSMPFTCACCIIGAASISAAPMFCGFISKSMVVTAAAESHMTGIWFTLMFASAGVLVCCGIKLPYFAFFAKDAGVKTEKAPINMRIAMGIAAFLCVFIGVYPQSLYQFLPHHVEYIPYTASHILGQLQLMFFAGLAFVLFLIYGIYPSDIRAVNVDSDWIFRRGIMTLINISKDPVASVFNRLKMLFFEKIPTTMKWFSTNPPAAIHMLLDLIALPFVGAARKLHLKKQYEIEKATYPGHIIQARPVGATLLFIAEFLVAYLVAYFVFDL